MSTWTGPWRVANDDKEHVYAVQHLVTAELRDIHVARMRFTPIRAPQGFPTIGEPRRAPHRSISAIKWAASGDKSVVKEAWEGLEEAESTWEPVSCAFNDAPAVLRKELKALRLKAEQKRARVQRYGLRL